jgi:hypothetical protein
LEKITNGVSQKAPIAEADLAGHIGNKEGQEIGSGNRERDAAINDDTLKDNQVLDAINLLKSMHILGQQPAASNEQPDASKRNATATNIEAKPQTQDKPQ